MSVQRGGGSAGRATLDILPVLSLRVVAALFIGVLLQHWRLIPMALFSDSVALTAVILLFLILLVSSIVGLLRRDRWGFYAVYALVPVSTVIHGIALVPVVTRLLPAQARPVAVLVINLAVLTTVAASHVSYRKHAHPSRLSRPGG